MPKIEKYLLWTVLFTAFVAFMSWVEYDARIRIVKKLEDRVFMQAVKLKELQEDIVVLDIILREHDGVVKKLPKKYKRHVPKQIERLNEKD